ncbi:helix-turn-helix domain-containing protein [Mesobacillus maritimus]|uniref:helix-turn-helix domain-containing protein n=1 Tax=Mesobacillus maritimus TaxID=1643336 RepID=UPI002559E0E3|nr:helix-turn-helix domain-containing protein [Mesobacillus maritimus]
MVYVKGSQPRIPVNIGQPSTPSFSISEQSELTFTYPLDFKVRIVYQDGNQPFTQDTIDLLYHLLYPLYTNAAMNSKNVELEKLIEGAQNITSLLDIDELLRNILDSVAAVIPGANTSAFWVYDPAIDRLVCKAYRGWKSEILHVQYKIGESVTGKTFRDGKTRIFHSFRKANEAMKGTSKRNSELLLAAFFHKDWVKASVTVPVKFHNEISGVLSFHQNGHARELTDWDLKLLKGLTAQIAIAYENAQLFSEIKRKNQVLVRRNEVHATLTKLSLQNKGVGSIAKELNRMIKPTVVFVDLLEEESYPKRDQRYFTFDELSKMLSDRKQPIYVDLYAPDKKSFYIYPILVGNACSACLVVTGDPPLSQLDHMILDEIDLEIQRIIKESYARAKQILTDNRDKLDIIAKTLLEVETLDAEQIRLIIEFSKFYDLQVLETKVHHFVWTIKQKVSEKGKIVFGNHNKVFLLFSLETPSDKPKVMKLLKSILTDWQESESIHLYAGVGRLYKGKKSINRTHNEATKAFSYLLSCKTPGMIDYAEIGINRLFINHSQEELEQFIEEIFSPLNVPKFKHSELELTLTTYINNNRSATTTAETLHIHINTLYQRLKRIEDILDISLQDSEALLKIQLACHLRSTYI